MKDRSLKAFRILRTVSAILGCLFFLVSMILPFYHRAYAVASMIPEYKFYYSTYYWSFRASQDSRNFFGGFGATRPADYWFYEPGFYNYIPGPALSKVLIAIFAAQLLTLIFGFASVFSIRRILASAPLAFCSLVTILMIYTNIVLSPSNMAVDRYSLGYWFTYPAIMLFLLSLMLNIVGKKRGITHTAMRTQPTPITDAIASQYGCGAH